MPNEYKQILRNGFGMLAMVTGLLLLFFAGNSYQTFEQLFEVFRYEKRFTSNLYPFGFSYKTYQLTIGCLTFLCISSFFLFFRTGKALQRKTFTEIWGLHLKTLGFPFKKLRQQWKLLPTWEKTVFAATGLLLIVIRIYLLQIHAVITDEAATYLHFVSKGLIASLSYYPIPNNHILYSIVCLPFDLVFEKAFWVLKLPALLINLALFPIVYLSLRSVFSFPVAFITTVGCSFSNYVLYYSVHGRGYILLLLCTIIATIAFIKLVQQKSPLYWLLFMLVSVAGFLTIPVFLYPFASLVISGTAYFLYTRNLNGFGRLVLACLFISVITLLLYLPAMLVSGPAQLFGNDYVQSSGERQTYFAKLPFYIGYMHGAILGQESLGKFLWAGGVGLFLIMLLIRRVRHRFLPEVTSSRAILLVILCSSALPFVLMTIHGVMPPERIWLFLVFADFLLVAISFQVALNIIFRKYQKAIPAITIICMALYISYQLVKQVRDLDSDTSLGKTTEVTLRNVHQYGFRTVFSNCNAYATNVQYELLYSAEKKYLFDEFKFNPSRKYDVLILAPELPKPALLELAAYNLFYENDRMQIYFRR